MPNEHEELLKRLAKQFIEQSPEGTGLVLIIRSEGGIETAANMTKANVVETLSRVVARMSYELGADA